MEVKLGNYTRNAVEEIYRAYRLCYSSGKQSEIKIPKQETAIGDIPDVSAMGDFIKPKMASGHTSPLEHASFTFYISGVSRALTHQLVRHRTGKFCQQSQRYVRMDDFDFVTPESIIKNGFEDAYIEHMKETAEFYSMMVESGVPKEDARFVFPNAATSNITVTFDANNFRKFLAQRECKHAQSEIRELAHRMCVLAEQVIPFIGYKAMNCGITCQECIGKDVYNG